MHRLQSCRAIPLPAARAPLPSAPWTAHRPARGSAATSPRSRVFAFDARESLVWLDPISVRRSRCRRALRRPRRPHVAAARVEPPRPARRRVTAVDRVGPPPPQPRASHPRRAGRERPDPPTSRAHPGHRRSLRRARAVIPSAGRRARAAPPLVAPRPPGSGVRARARRSDAAPGARVRVGASRRRRLSAAQAGAAAPGPAVAATGAGGRGATTACSQVGAVDRGEAHLARRARRARPRRRARPGRCGRAAPGSGRRSACRRGRRASSRRSSSARRWLGDALADPRVHHQDLDRRRPGPARRHAGGGAVTRRRAASAPAWPGPGAGGAAGTARRTGRCCRSR